MGEFLARMMASWPAHEIPLELALLFEWVEQQGETREVRGDWYGLPYDPAHPRGTQITFQEMRADKREYYLTHWFDGVPPSSRPRLWPFARTGADGSYALVWFPEDSPPSVVHLGSGSGSTFVGVIADEPVDFIRLVAIGYDEICWQETYAAPPNAERDGAVEPHLEFRRWVETQFETTIPVTGLELVPHPANMADDEGSDDPFLKVVLSIT